MGLPNAGAQAMGPPQFLNHKNGVRIAHREYIQDIYSTTQFSLNNFFLNPGLKASFPWLCNIATNFEQYKWLGIMFEFRSTSANALNSTNTALGTVVMATDYNPAAPNFTNKPQMEQNEWTTSSAPSVTFQQPIECDPSQNPLKLYLVRSGGIPTGQDQRMFDLANFQIATVGMQAASAIGELWVTYDVQFFKPVLNLALPSGGLGAGWQCFQCTSGNFIGNPTYVFNNCGIEISPGDGVTSAMQVLFPAGTLGIWQVAMSFSSNGSVSAGGAAFAGGLDQSINLDVDTLAPMNSPYPGQTTNQLGGTLPTQQNTDYILYVIMGDDQLPSVLVVTYSAGTKLPGTTTNNTCQLVITQVPDDITMFADLIAQKQEEKNPDGPGLEKLEIHDDYQMEDSPAMQAVFQANALKVQQASKGVQRARPPVAKAPFSFPVQLKK